MTSWLASLPSLGSFFPPTPRAFKLITLIYKAFPVFSLMQWTSLRRFQTMGKTSADTTSWTNLPGRFAWSVAEAVGPFNLIYILYTLPKQLKPKPDSASSLFGTGLPIQNEIMGLLYVLHYINRAGVTPWLLAPSMSPINVRVSAAMAVFQYLNSSAIACWLTYSMTGKTDEQTRLLSLPAVIGISLWITGLAGNIIAENALFSLRRAAAKRRAKSEGKATITYDKVYVIPPAEGLYKHIMSPHYALEWIEWTGYWILGAAWGLGWDYKTSAPLWFLINELVTMTPRAYETLEWYEKKFGKKPLAGRKAVIPGIL